MEGRKEGRRLRVLLRDDQFYNENLDNQSRVDEVE